MTSEMIMIVDDDQDMREMLAMAVEETGYTPLKAQNGREALSLLDHHIPVLVLSDLMMPVMDGRRLYQAMQKHPIHRHVPFVVVSSFPPRLVMDNNMSPAAVIQKPFDLMTLIDTIEELLYRPPQQRGSNMSSTQLSTL
ncbi:MAG: response regulator [Chloroflexaceae bacterium]|nr:response regulator [Chloroflexaceae bacterium]